VYKQNVVGSLLQGRSWNSHCFKAWKVCWPCALSKVDHTG